MNKRIAVALLALSTSALAAPDPLGVVPVGAQCSPGLHEQPNGPFAVMLFCEDALASHLGVVYAKHMTNPFDGKWSLTDRFWQSPDWGADVTAYAWDKGGEQLVISTSAVYGTGEIHLLDLRSRMSRRLFPKGKNDPLIKKVGELCLTELTAVDPEKRSVSLKLTGCDNKTIVTGKVAY